jgi:type II secretion system protein N
MPDKRTIIRRLLFAGYFVAAFFIFLLLLFPFDRIKSRIESEVRLRTSFELTISRISPRFFNTVVLSDVVVSDRTGRVLFESPSIRTTISFFGLIRGLLGLNLKASAYSGDLLVKLQQGPGRQYFFIDASGLDIGAYPLLRDAGFHVTGKLGGNYEMSGDSGKGRLWIKGVTSRDLTVKGFKIPDLDFDQCWLEAEVKGDRLMVKKLDMEGKEVKIRATGDLVLRERGMMNLAVKLKLSERMAQEQSWVPSLLKNKDAEGYYLLTLGGTLAEPMPRL